MHQSSRWAPGRCYSSPLWTPGTSLPDTGVSRMAAGQGCLRGQPLSPHGKPWSGLLSAICLTTEVNRIKIKGHHAVILTSETIYLVKVSSWYVDYETSKAFKDIKSVYVLRIYSKFVKWKCIFACMYMTNYNTF